MRPAPALGLVVSAVLAVWAASGARAAEPGDPQGRAAVTRPDLIIAGACLPEDLRPEDRLGG
jgi:hypothetical protein